MIGCWSAVNISRTRSRKDPAITSPNFAVITCLLANRLSLPRSSCAAEMASGRRSPALTIPTNNSSPLPLVSPSTVRAAAAWALRQIGTEAALEAAAAYTDERSYLVQHEADLAAAALGDDDADAEAPTA